MKVTVCFNSVRVVVPCGDGNFSVRDLTSRAVIRYSKATAKQADSWVTVHNLRQLDGGILDPDDRLNDVADDREQIIANFDESNSPHQGDGTSASDQSETSTPDIYQNAPIKFDPFSSNGIEITGEELTGTPPPLHVRRGSEPALNRLSPIPTYNTTHQEPNKRWSAAPVVEGDVPSSSTPMKDKINFYGGFPGERGEGSGEEKNPSSATSSGSSHHSATTTTISRFSRDTNRCSVQILSDNPSMSRWAEAADRAASECKVQPEAQRREPVGGVTTPIQSREPSIVRSRPSSSKDCRRQLVVLPNDGSHLGIHVIPSHDKFGHELGIYVEGIDLDGRVGRDGNIQVNDIVIEINGQSLRNVTFHQAQKIFKDAMNANDLRLLVLKYSEITNLDTNELVESHQKTLSGVSKVANVTATRKVPAASLSSRTQSVILQSNTRKIGKKVSVNLVKSVHGLGFSITTRDNPAGGEAPIYIKNILPKGAAIEEGTLKIGDRLLEVNGVAVTGYNQSDVANLLRQIQIGTIASLMVSRQERPLTDSIVNFDYRSVDLDGVNERNPESPKLPRQLVGVQASEKSTEDSLMLPWKQREILKFEIPVHDSERAGLGVSVKGETSSGPNGSVDLGVFVKNVIHGGAASKDGRLSQSDQLVNINAISLLGKSNSQAMNTLRTAMYQEGPIPGMITLTIARRLDAVRDSSGARSGRDSVNSMGTTSSGTETLTLGGTKSGFATPTPDHSGASDMTNSTVVYVRQNDDKMVGHNAFGYDHQTYDGMHVNPVIQRLTGVNSNQALRNESYYRATHETWNASQLQHFAAQERNLQEERNRARGRPKMASPTVNPPSRETVIIHDEYDVNDALNRYNTNPPNMASSNGMYIDQPSQSSDAYVSQSSLEESIAGFLRDQVGRQSISEKRHATLDAKATDTYQRSKKAREEREKMHNNIQSQPYGQNASRNHTLLRRSPTPVLSNLPRASSEESLQKHEIVSRTSPLSDDFNGQKGATHRSVKDIGPGLGMRKSSSLESLQTMVQEMTLEENGKRLGTGKVPRGRGCNESFRAAVDRSYDAPLSSDQMETVNEEESESSGSGFGRNNSRQSSVNSTADDRKRHYRKRQGILKGLGSMFRFGKHRKTPEPDLSANEALRKDNYEAARKHHQEEQDRMTQKYRAMLENQQQESMQKKQMSSGAEDDSNTSRCERMHQLRAEHQRRHAERNRTYPTDDIEDRYDHAIKQGCDTSMNNGTSNTTNTDQSQVLSSSMDNSSKNASNSTKSVGQSVVGNFDKHDCVASNCSRGVVLRRNKNRSLCRSSLYSGCLRPVRSSPSPPNSYGTGDAYVPNADPEDITTLETNLQPDDLNFTSSTSSLVNKNLSDGLRGLIIQKGVSHKPPLPPRNRPINNNYKPPAPPPHNKPVYSVPHPNPKKLNANFDRNVYKDDLKMNNLNSLNDLIGPNFSFSFNKPLLPYPSNITNSRSASSTTLADIEAQNVANQTQSDLGCSKLFYESAEPRAAPFYNVNQIIAPPFKDYNWNLACQPQSSGSSTTSSNGSTRSNSLPRMGLNGKTAAKLLRNGPCPAPVPPPKGFRNCLAPLRSTEVLDQRQFWRLEPVPAEPKAEIEHIRSKSYDVYGSNRKKMSRAPFQDPNNYSHYVNYEQIQMHMRKNKEQERLAQLASQQYQDFRDKQTSREQREYQSQRSSREASYQQRPVSNYFEYESVQAMMSHAQNNHGISSLPRRNHHTAPLPHGGQQSNIKNGSLGRQGAKDFQHKQSSYGGFTQSAKTNNVGREGIYAASGFRPASQYQYKSGPSFQQSSHPANSKV